jgi:cell division protein FtsQ
LAISITHLSDSILRSRRLVVASAIALVAGLLVGAIAVSRSWLFDVRTVDVVGRSHLSAATVEELAGIAAGTSVWWLDEGALEERLERHPWIADAAVSTSLPRSVSIRIHEREPVAVLTQATGRSLLAGDGTVLGVASIEASQGLPEVVANAVDDDAVAGAAGVVASMPRRLAPRLDRVEILGDGSLELRVDDEIRVRYGYATGEPSGAAAAAKAATILRLLAWSAARDGELATLNVMAPAVPTVTFHD